MRPVFVLSVKQVYMVKVKRFFIYSILSLILLFIVIALSLSIGSTEYSFSDVLRLLIYDLFRSLGLRVYSLENYSRISTIVYSIRLPRTIVATLAGAGLGIAGVLVQAITRNPLAEPFLLGLSSTSLTIVGLSILIVPGLLYVRAYIVLAAFIGALLGFFITITLSELAGGSALTLILAGIAVSSAFGGLSHIIAFLVQVKFNMPFLILLLGSFSNVLKGDIHPITISLVIGIIGSMMISKALNALLYGDEYASQLGYNPKLTRRIAASLSALLTGVTVAIAGIIGFIGLVVPHITRFLIGGGDHRFVIPLSAFIGAILLLISDIIARILSYTTGITGIPVGAITSIMGAPFFAYLLVKKMRGSYS